MQTDKIKISSNGAGMAQALEECDRFAAYTGLDKRSALHVRLLAEEALGMVRGIVGNFQADFWLETAKKKLDDTEAIADLVMQMGDCHYTDCSVEEIAAFAERLSESETIHVYELPGEAIRGKDFMEYYVDDEQVQQIVLKLFYKPVL